MCIRGVSRIGTDVVIRIFLLDMGVVGYVSGGSIRGLPASGKDGQLSCGYASCRQYGEIRGGVGAVVVILASCCLRRMRRWTKYPSKLALRRG